MPDPIRILFIDDVKDDCNLVVTHFTENGYHVDFERVETFEEMEAAIAKSEFDLILCDHGMPNFDIFSALALATEKIPNVPFISLSGTVSEEAAIEAVQSGVRDYILKNNLSRLIPAVRRELSEARNHSLYLSADVELKKKDAELRQAYKLEAIGQLAGGIAHDFNNILAVVLMQAEAAMDKIDEDPELKKLSGSVYKSLVQIKRAGERAAGLTSQLLTFSRKQVVQPKVLDINEIVRELEKMLSRLIEENVTLVLELGKNLKNIKADLGHIEQIIMNLVVNSRDAMPSGGKITIKTTNSFLESVSYILLEVSDTGIGMSEETLKRVFDPFFTTKEIGKGTGLGLSTVYGIVKQINGFVFVESKLNVGTTFKVYFRPTDEGVQIKNLAVIENNNLRGTETILVAEDEPELRKLVCEKLREAGYTVLEAQDGIGGLALIENHKSQIQLVLTDLIMPNMGGQEMAERARATEFKAKFLFLSGYTEIALLQKEIDSGRFYFLEKPYTMKALLKKVRTILEEGS